VGEALKVFISDLLRPIMIEFCGGGIRMLPNLGMAIGEVQRKAIVMTMRGVGREIDPHLGFGVGHKKTVVDAALILIQQHP